jgi:hypothetical protein
VYVRFWHEEPTGREPAADTPATCQACAVSDLDPKQVVASFDSASVLHAATVAALNGQPFPQLGNSALAGLAVRAASQLPWSVLRGVYTRIGASEGINPKRLSDVDLAAVAASFADRYRSGATRPYCSDRATER